MECVRDYKKRIDIRLRNLKEKEKGLGGEGGRGRLTDATTDHLQNSGGVAICQNKENLEKMKSSLLASLFHVASNKDNNFHFSLVLTVGASLMQIKGTKKTHTNLDQDY